MKFGVFLYHPEPAEGFDIILSNQTRVARMPVPKMVKNGDNSHFGHITYFLFPFRVHALKCDLNAKSRLKTIFNHFRNTHAHLYEVLMLKRRLTHAKQSQKHKILSKLIYPCELFRMLGRGGMYGISAVKSSAIYMLRALHVKLT